MALVAIVALTVLAAPVHAGAMAPPPPLPYRIAWAKAIVVGKVTVMEPKPVRAPRHGGAQAPEVDYTIAVVKVTEGLHGVKGLTHVRVGLPPPPPPFRGSGGVLRRVRTATLVKGQEALLFLTPHPKENFYVLPNYYDVVYSKSPTFARDVDLARRGRKLLADPMAGLKAKAQKDRLLTAGLLLARYRMPPGGPHRPEPVPAEESKLILKALAEADWKNPLAGVVAPQKIFYMLGATAKDGWRRPADFRKFGPAAKEWLEKNAETFRLTRSVPANKEQ